MTQASSATPPGIPSPRPARRILALRFPLLPIDRLLRRERCGAPDERPENDHPLVIAARVRGALRLAAVDERAAGLGIAPGMALAQARALHPALRVAEADEAADEGLLEAVAEWCDRFTPLVALDPPHGLLLDVTGCPHLFGGEAAMLARVRGALEAQGLRTGAAIAGTAMAARALALARPGTVVPPGGEPAAVAPLGLAMLGVEPGIAAGLARAGFRTAGEADARPRAELAARFGPGLLAVLDEAFGRADAPISPRRPVPDAIAEQRFPEPVATEGAVRGAVRALAGTLGGLLERRQEGARLLELAVFRADGAVRRIAVETGRPTRDPEVVERLFRERFDALSDPLDPGFGFDLVRLSAHRIEPLRPRAVTLDARTLDDEEIAELVDRLAARYGGRRVLRFQAQDTHLPEAAARAVPAQAASRPRTSTVPDSLAEDGLPPEPPSRPISLFDPPEPIEVLAEIPEGPPARFRWRRVLRPVVRAEGPERIAMEWWRSIEPGLTRDYYRVEDGQGRRYWIFRAGLYGREISDPRWFLHGLFA